MTTGSAASLAGTLPKAPLSPFPVARRDNDVAFLPYGQGDHDAPPRIGSLLKAAGEPPRGHVLVAAGEAETALELQRVWLSQAIASSVPPRLRRRHIG